MGKIPQLIFPCIDFYLYEKGGHGFGLNNKTSEVKWMDLVQEWMTKSGWMKNQ